MQENEPCTEENLTEGRKHRGQETFPPSIPLLRGLCVAVLYAPGVAGTPAEMNSAPTALRSAELASECQAGAKQLHAPEETGL